MRAYECEPMRAFSGALLLLLLTFPKINGQTPPAPPLSPLPPAPSVIVFNSIDISNEISSNNKFQGAATTPTGLVVFAPLDADCVGTYNALSGAFACVDISSILSSDDKFSGAAIAVGHDDGWGCGGAW